MNFKEYRNMKTILEWVIRQMQPGFRVDPAIPASALWSKIYFDAMATIRGWKLLFHGIRPNHFSMGKQVKLFNPRHIEFRGNNLVGDYSYLHALGKNSITFGKNSGVGSFCQVISSVQFHDISGFIKLGDNVWIGDGSNIGGAGGVTIGDDTFMGQYITIHPENHRFDDPNTLFRLQGVTRKGIKIGKNCWIGAKTTITDGVTIGNNCVVAAGSVVTKNVESNSLIAGVPARLIRKIECNL